MNLQALHKRITLLSMKVRQRLVAAKCSNTCNVVLKVNPVCMYLTASWRQGTILNASSF